ncbi:MAG: transketolase [Candidatus Nanopelagicales bacterium]
MTIAALPPLSWTPSDDDAVRHLRALAADAVQNVGNGHPGTAMALAPAAYLLFQKVMQHDPSDPRWLGRDRFVLSCGHSSLTLYSQLFLAGYGLSIDDLRSFRQAGSLTPGHPEYRHTAGVETTTGPLGAGLSTAVGMAMSARYERGLLDPAAPAGASPFDHRVFVFASDGDLEEGVTSEASSLAGTQQLGNLIVIWDDNRISIEGDTALAFTENVCERYRAYGWDVHEVPLAADGSADVAGLYAAIVSATASPQPSFIRLSTVIAWPAPQAKGTAKSHGSALGAEEVSAIKTELGLDPSLTFQFDETLLGDIRTALSDRVSTARTAWDTSYASWRTSQPDHAALLDRLLNHELPMGIEAAYPQYDLGSSVSTRKASGEVINAVAVLMPELWGGSADLAESNNTTIEGGKSFLPDGSGLPDTSPYGRILHFGIREHAMGSILNGIALDTLTRPFGGTFMVFSDYMRGAVRLTALMNLAVTYIWTHDSIGLGEDGPTHQPVEHLWALRAIPNLAIIRPADANETSAAWQGILSRRAPAGLILTRQNVPTLVPAGDAVSGVVRGAYVLRDSADPQVLLLATGSEVQLALAAADILESEGVAARVISMPCLEWFDAQDATYRQSVWPSAVHARVSVEAGATLGWWKYLGTDGRAIGLDHFGASADYQVLYREFGITVEAIVAAAHESLASDSGKQS